MQIGKYSVKRKYTIPHIIIDIASAVLIILIWVVLSNQLSTLPSKVPFHINAQGEGKLILPSFLLAVYPLIAMGITALSIWLSFHPEGLAKRFDASPTNAQPFCNIVVSMLGEIRVVLLLIVMELFFGAVQTANGEQGVPSFLALWCLILIIIMVRIRTRQIKRIEY